MSPRPLHGDTGAALNAIPENLDALHARAKGWPLMSRRKQVDPMRARAESPPRPPGGSLKRPLLLGGLLALLVAGGLAGYTFANARDGASNAPPTSVLTEGVDLRQPVHDHADLAIVLRGQVLDLSAAEFLSTEDEAKSENIHIHAPRTAVLHIHREQTTWSELFLSLGGKLSDTCMSIAKEEYCSSASESLKFLVNGVQVDSIRFMEIGEMDRVLISYGSETDEQVLTQLPLLTDQACIPSENCAARVDPNNPEVEPCAKSETSCVD